MEMMEREGKERRSGARLMENDSWCWTGDSVRREQTSWTGHGCSPQQSVAHLS